MMTSVRCCALALLVGITCRSLAQEQAPVAPPKPSVSPEQLIGTWDGGFQPSSLVATFGYRIQITSVQGTVVTGKGRIFGQRWACEGEFPITGSIQGNRLTLRAAEGFGTFKDCRWSQRCEIEGDTCTGKRGNNRVTFKKQ